MREELEKPRDGMDYLLQPCVLLGSKMHLGVMESRPILSNDQQSLPLFQGFLFFCVCIILAIKLHLYDAQLWSFIMQNQTTTQS